MKSLCPACQSFEVTEHVESYLDPTSGRKQYELWRSECGVVFADPLHPVSPEWYEKQGPGKPFPAHRDWRYKQFFKDKLGGLLLDFGCGDGAFLGLALEKGINGIGVDFQDKLQWIENPHAAKFWLTRIEDFNPPAPFDTVTMFDVLEHQHNPIGVLCIARRALQPKGHLVITLPNANRPLPWGREPDDYPPHHFTRWTPAALRAFLENNGFEVIRLEADHLSLWFFAEHFFHSFLAPKLIAIRNWWRTSLCG